MPRLLRRLLLIVVLIGAWALIGKHHAPLPLTLNEASAGTRVHAGEHNSPKDLSQLRIFNKVVLYVKDNYVDPQRVKPKDMMVQALEYVEKTVPEVMVDGTAETGTLKVTAGNQVRTWDISQLDSLWKMSFTLHDIMGFIGENMRPVEDIHDVEYAAINGMLSTLDPHSVLLRPEIYRDLQASTKGEFGGLGFVIQMKEGNLTVVKVLPKTPAYRAGIKKDDQIRKIGEESTINMDLNDAVSKLRGPVGSQVTITIAREGWDKPRAMTITRAQITLESVMHKLLAHNVGYIRLKNFQGNTTHDMQAALDDLEQKTAKTGGLKGLVLDLRGNPGGLLDQAVQVSDTFVSHGTLVATVGYSDKMRDEKHATSDEGDVKYPMAVLVNSGSASASEIVAGALKNLNRATIIGQQTFGKGSVQMLYEFPDDSALKLTIAKYLTPGDVSIQEIGIEPDIALVPTRVTEDRVNVFAPRKSMGEADLSHHFGNPENKTVAKSREDVVGVQKPLEELRYLKETAKTKAVAKAEKAPGKAHAKPDKHPKQAEKRASPAVHEALLDADVNDSDESLYDQLDAETVDKVKEDFEIDFARDFVLHAPSMDRKAQLKEAKAFVEERKGAEQERINHAIAQLGVDWSPGARPQAVALSASVAPGPDQHLKAGEVLNLQVTAQNRGKVALSRVRAWTDSDDPWLDRREFLFGKLAPGEKRTWTVPIKLPKDLTTRREDVTVKFFDDQGALSTQVVSELDFVELPRPAFALNWQVVDDCQACNGDGVANRGERVRVLLDVTNTGKGQATAAYVTARNGADANIFIDQGRFKLGELAPGETKTATLILDVKPGFAQKSFLLKTAVIDESLEEFSSEKITLPVGESAPTVASRNAVLRVTDGAALFGSATDGAEPIAQAPKGALVQEVGQVGKYAKIAYGPDRFAFVPKNEVKEVSSRAAAKASKEAWLKDVKVDSFRVPPTLTTNVDDGQGGIIAEGDQFTLSGTATDPRGLLDVYVLVNDQKVFFRTADPSKPKPTQLSFSAKFPLKEGNNYVMVVARQTEEFSGKKMLVVRRRPVAIAQALAHARVEASTAPAPSPSPR